MKPHVEIKSIDLPLGEVRKVSFGQNIPEGWRKMRMEQGRLYKNELQSLLSTWSIVAFQIGAIVGQGYGFKFWEHYGGECGEGFIIGPRSSKQAQTENTTKQAESHNRKSNQVYMQEICNTDIRLMIDSQNHLQLFTNFIQMLTLPQSPTKVLLISTLYLNDHPILEVAQQIIAYNKKQICQIMARSYSGTNEIDLKLALLIQSNLQDPRQKWVMCTSLEWKNGEIGPGYEGVFVVQEQDGWVDDRTDSNVFAVRGLRECLTIVGMTKAELQKRWKMEMLLRKSNLKYKHNKSQIILKSMATRIMQSAMSKQISILKRYFDFYSHCRLKLMRKYYTQWLIWHYEAVIHKKEDEIVEGKYLVEGSSKKILQKCLAGWKALVVKKKPIRN